MAKKPQNIKITPKLIEFEDHILRVPNIATVTIGPDPKRRFRAILLFALSLSFTMATTGALLALLAKGAIGSLLQTLPTAVAAVALFLWARKLFKYLALVISTADSRFTVLVDKSPDFMREVMSRIREALLAGEEGNVYYQVNVQAEKIERLDANSTVVSNSAGAVVAGGSMEGLASVATGGVSGGIADIVGRAREQVAPIAGKALQTAGELATRGRSLAEERITSMRQAGGASASTVNANVVNVSAAAPGAIIAGGGMSMSGSQVSTHGSIVNDFDNIVASLSQLSITHKEEIIAYIKPVRDHLAGGPTTREDAKTRWAWFAANVASALSGVDGVLAVIERLSRLLGVGR